MRFATITVAALSTLTLAACQTSSLTDAQKEGVTHTDQAFSGTMKDIDAEASVISFVGGSTVVDHEGKFNEYEAHIMLDETDPANLEKAAIMATIDLTSAVTDAEGLNGHLQKADFFETATYPQATFNSTNIASKGGNMYAVTGDLTVKGVTKSVSFDAEITDEYLTATYEFPRKEFGVGNDTYGQKLLDETVPVNVKLVFKK